MKTYPNIMTAGSRATMEATPYRKYRKQWNVSPAVVSTAQSIDRLFTCNALPQIAPTQTETTRTHISTALKHKKMKGGCA
jgi:hypothetical protein